MSRATTTTTAGRARQSERSRTSGAERLLTAALALTILEGALRKWVIGTSTSPIAYAAYLSKDALLVAIALLVRPRPPCPAARELARYVGAGTLLVVLGAMLSATAAFTPAGAFLSARSLIVLPVVLALLGPRLAEVDVLRVARRLAYLVIPVAVLGALQFNLPPGHVLNRQPDGAPPIVAVGHVRATGTFSFISGMGHMAVVGVWCGLLLGAIRRNAPTYRLGLITVGAGFTSALACLSRGPAVISAGVVLAAFFVSRLNLKLIFGGLFVVAMVQLASPEDVQATADQPGLVSALVVRHKRSDSVGDRVGTTVGQVVNAVLEFPAGGGFGLGQVGGYAVSGGVRRLAFFEAELARVVVEVGWIGLLGTLIFRFGVLYTVVRYGLLLPPGPRRERVLVSAVTACGFFIGNQTFDHVASAFNTIVLAIAMADLQVAWSKGRRPA